METKIVRSFTLMGAIEKAEELQKEGWRVKQPANIGFFHAYIIMEKSGYPIPVLTEKGVFIEIKVDGIKQTRKCEYINFADAEVFSDIAICKHPLSQWRPILFEGEELVHTIDGDMFIVTTGI